MAARQPIGTAPRNGSKVRVVWTDEDGQENESIARFRSLDQLKAAGGEWDDADAGWWIFIDGRTQKRVDPTAWIATGEDDEEQ